MKSQVLILAVLSLAALTFGIPNEGGDSKGKEGPPPGMEPPQGMGPPPGMGPPNGMGPPPGMGPPNGRGPQRFEQCCPSMPNIFKRGSNEEGMRECLKQSKPSDATVAQAAPAASVAASGSPMGGGRGRGGGGGGRGGPGMRHGGPWHGGCGVECKFKVNKLATTAADGTVSVDTKALNDYLTTFATGAWEQPIKNAQAKCVTDAAIVREESQPCKSGARGVAHCIMRSLFDECPDKNTTDKECARISEMKKEGSNSPPAS